ncbi:hypothetical protein [Methanohalophilus halophilus]|uniref:Uncharacterized protein n=2 Tax=Methanohalophilus halophilus TaxID=2177 RepID=A0A1L3Q1R5_9EURY|nr:hypothetical protein [Methanohalophilus halophilus]APH38819.1 hypothetical protein BHR79_04500 [Methanohalophilus halophilus]RNI08014.1 hypothetical protein EFE40_08675 [Methanohalophilus halophilus]SDW71140.1 hypothetical protein SAMN04515625_1473 [Methanohalophilus halophilus]
MNGQKNIIAIMSGLLICLLLMGTAAAAPAIDSAYTVDDDGDGYIDAYELTFNESVNDSTFDSSAWTIGDYTGYSATDVSEDTIRIVFNEKSTPDTDVTPDITTTGPGIYSMADEALPSVTSGDVNENDGAAPVIISQEYFASDAGDVDEIVLTFSENIDYGTYEDADWDVNAKDLTGLDVTDGTVVDSNTLTLSATANNGITSAVDEPTIDYVLQGTSNVTDDSNELVGVSGLVLSDKAAPVIETVTSDATEEDVLGIGDTITFTATPTATEDGLDIVSDSYNGVDLEWSTNDNGANYKTTYTVKEGDDTTEPLQLTGVTATDAAGNEGPSADGSDVAVTIDATYPEIESAQTIDANENGKIDGYKITFTESVDDSTYNNSLWSIEDHVAEELNTVNEVDDSTIIVNINESESQDVDQTPDFGVAEDAIRDGAGNPILGVTSGTIDVTDGAAPVVLNATTVDSDGNGLLDNYTIEFSEAMDDSTLNYSKWTVAGMSITGYDTDDAEDDNIIMLELEEAIGYGTTDTPDITVSGAEVTDITGNVLDNVAEGDIDESDGAGPAIESVTCDATGVLGIDDTIIFSVKLNESESDVTIQPQMYNGGALEWSTNDNGQTYNATYTVEEGQDLSTSLNLTDVNATDASGNTGLSVNGTDMEATIDATRPYIVNATTIDWDGNGSIDGYEIVFNENVSDDTNNTSAWYIDGFTGLDFDTGDAANDNIIILNFTESGDYNANTAPNVTTDAGAIADMAGNDINSTSETDVTEEDGAAPVIESVTSDATEEGVLGIDDTINFTVTMAYEEDVTISPTTYNDGELVWTTGDGGLTYNATYTVESGQMSYVDPLQLTGVNAIDASGNPSESVNGDDVNKTIDAGGPIVVAAETVDIDYNGMIDGYNLTFTEPINDSTFNYENWDVEGYTVTGFNTETPDDRYGILVFEEGSSTDTDAVPAFNNVSTPEVEDADGYTMPEEFGDAEYLNDLTEDGAAPVLMHAEIDSSEYPYLVDVIFSEPVDEDAENGNVTFNDGYPSLSGSAESWFFRYDDQLQTGDSPEITAVNNMMDDAGNAAVLYGNNDENGVVVNTFRKELKAGYNYVSFPIADEGDVSLADVGLDGNEVESVWTYNPQDGWIVDSDDVFEIAGGVGYIVYANEDFFLAPNVNNYPDNFESPAFTNVYEGWNLVGHYKAYDQPAFDPNTNYYGGAFETIVNNMNFVMYEQRTAGELGLRELNLVSDTNQPLGLSNVRNNEISTGNAYWINLNEVDQYSAGGYISVNE